MKKMTIDRLAGIGLMLTLLFVMTSSRTYAWKGIKGSGDVEKETREVGSFTGIDVGGAFKVFLTQGSEYKVVVEADGNLLPVIETKVKGDELHISTTEEIRDATELNLYITFKNLSDLDISGACHLKGENEFKLEDFELECSGASNVDFTVAAYNVEMDISGAANIDISGKAETVEIELSGAADYDALDFAVDSYEVDISGAASGKIHAVKELAADVSGAAKLRYKGDPSITEFDVSGAGSMKKY